MAGLSRRLCFLRFGFQKRLSSTYPIVFDDIVPLETIAKKDDKVKSGVRQKSGVARPSDQFLHSLSEFPVMLKVESNKDRSSNLIKHQLYNLVVTRQIETLADLFLELNASPASKQKLHSVLKEHLPYYIRFIIDYQIQLVKRLSEYKVSERSKAEVSSKSAAAKRLRQKIRTIYSRLLYSDSHTFLYGTSVRSNLYNAENLTGYKLSVKDYENLIKFELHNLKPDLADKWFQRLQQQYPHNLHYEVMTYSMWILKFQTYCGGAPFLWRISESALYSSNYNPRRSNFRAETTWLPVFIDFLKYYNNNATSKGIINDKLNEILIYSIGHSGDVDSLCSYIDKVWGISRDFRLREGAVPLKRENMMFPSMDTLKAIVISFAYNQQYSMAIKYINAFQDLYGDAIDFSSRKAKLFWDNIFKWSDIVTRFHEDRALTLFLKENSVGVGSHKKKANLEEAKGNADFDFEAYLNFIDELRNTRKYTIGELWKLYSSQVRFFSSRPHSVYLKFLNEIQDESKFYAYLTFLTRCFHSYHISETSFNKLHLVANRANDIDRSIYAFYNNALRSLINIKWKTGYLGQCEPLIEEWSLDLSMRHNLSVWLRSEIYPNYKKMMDDKRAEAMIKQKQDEEPFLDLF